MILDDFRFDDLEYMPQLQARIAAGSVFFRHHYSDDGSCAPTRRGILTGHATTWHRRDQDGTSYNQHCAEFRRIGALDQNFGPWEYEYTDDNRTGDANPDVRWSSGGLANWLREADDGIITALIGKHDHGYADDSANTSHRLYRDDDGPLGNPLAVERVPADWTFWSAHVGDDNTWDGGAPNLWRHKKAIKHENNVTNIGPDFTGGNKPVWLGGTLDNECAPDGWCDEIEYRRYDLATSVVEASNQGSGLPAGWTYAPNGVWHARADLTGIEHHIEIGDWISVEATCSGPGTIATTPPGAPSVGTPGTPGTEVQVVHVDGGVIYWALETNQNPGTISLFPSVPVIYPRRNYATWSDAYDFIDWSATRSLSDKWFAVLAFSAPHPNLSDSTEQEYRYQGTVHSGDFPNVVDHTLIDTGHALYNSAKTQWAQKMATCRTLDNAIEAVFQALEDQARLDRTCVIVTADQGVMYGERDFYTNGNNQFFVKRLAFAPVRSPLWMFHPHYEPQEVLYPTYCADLCPTVLDLMGLTSHHCHSLREGVSLLRVLDDHPYPNRAVWVYHDPKDQPGVDCMITPTDYKWIAQADPTSPAAGYVEFLFDIDADEYEHTNLAPGWAGPPSLATFAARAAALELAQGPARNADWTTL